MGLYSVDEPYSLASWYEHSGIYDLWTGTDLQLDLPRMILESDAYYYQGITFPNSADAQVGFQQTISGVMNIVPYSYVVAITGFSRNSNQFTIRLYDKGAQTDTYFKQFAWYPTVLSNMQDQVNMGDFVLLRDQDKPFSPYLFRDPFVVLPPGQLQWQLTNVESDPTLPSYVQVLLSLAVPKSTVSLQTHKVTTPTDPTGLTALMNLAG